MNIRIWVLRLSLVVAVLWPIGAYLKLGKLAFLCALGALPGRQCSSLQFAGFLGQRQEAVGVFGIRSLLLILGPTIVMLLIGFVIGLTGKGFRRDF